MTAPTELLSNRDALEYKAFRESLKLLSQGAPYLALLGCDSEALGRAIQANLDTQIPHLQVVDHPASADAFHRAFYEPASDTLLLTLYRSAAMTPDALAAQLIFYRDVVVRNDLNVIILVEERLFDAIHRQAYDLISAASFSHGFRDQAAATQPHFEPVAEKPAEVLDYEKALQAYRAEKWKWLWRRSRESIMKRAHALGVTALEISQSGEALPYFQEALYLAKKLNHQGYQGIALGHIGGIYSDRGELAEALRYHQAALEIDRRIGNHQGEAKDLAHLAAVYEQQSQYETAGRHYRQALAIYEQMGLTHKTGQIQQQLKDLKAKQTNV